MTETLPPELDDSHLHLVRLATYTHNYTDDWDRMCLCWDVATHQWYHYMDGTTRFAGRDPRYIPPTWIPYETLSPEELAQLKDALVTVLFNRLKHAASQRILTPNTLNEGDAVRLLEPHNKVRKITEPCRKCGGSGHWQNPKNPNDKRPCFACDGTGQHQTREEERDENGKRIYDEFSADTRGVVLSVKCYRTCYRNGYNQPGRNTNTVTIRTDDGRIVSVPQKKLRLDEEMPSDESLLTQARAEAENTPWTAVMGL